MRSLIFIVPWCLAFFVHCSVSHASLVIIDFRDPSGTGNTAGEAFDAGNTFVVSGLSLSAATSPVSSFNALTNNAGVGTGGEIDGSESVTLTFTFDSSAISVDLVSIDLSGVGSAGGGDAAFVSVAGGSPIKLETGVTGFNGSTDVWTPSPSVSMSPSDTIVFTAENSFGLQAMSLDIVSVPESAAVWFGTLACGVIGLGVGGRRLKDKLFARD